jgi:PAS domain S-box-containing protein
MWEKTRSLFTAPVFEGDEEKTRIAALLHIALVSLVVSGAIFLPLGALMPDGHPGVLVIMGALIGVSPVMLWGARRGYVRSVSVLLVCLFLAASVGSVAVVGSVRDAMASLFIVSVVASGVLLGHRGTIVVTGLTALALATLWWAEEAGLLPPYELTRFAPLLRLAGSLVGTALMLIVAVRGLNQALQRLRCSEALLTESNVRLNGEVVERKRAEEALRESLSVLRATLESTADAILVVDLQGRIVDCNQQLLRIWQMPSEIVPDGRSHDLVAAMGEDRLIAHFFSQLKDPAAFAARVQEIYEHPDSETLDCLEFNDGRIFERYSIPRRLGDQPIGRVWSFRDVTESRRMQDALRASEAKWRSYIENAPVGVLVADHTGRHIEANRFAEEMLGYGPGELVVTKVTDIPAHESAAAAKESFEKVVREGQAEGVFLARRKDGQLIWVSLRASRISDGRFMAVLQDITARKQAEEDRRKMDADLVRVQKLESLGVLAAGIAHDFNNILAGIQVFADLLQREPEASDSAKEKAAEIRKATRRGADLTRQILTYAGKGPVRLQSVDVNRMAEGMRSILEVAVSKKAALQFQLQPALPPVLADASEIGQVLLNLVVNGSEALGETAGEIVIETWTADADGLRPNPHTDNNDSSRVTHVCLEVSDNGCGMDATTMSRIFEPFFTTKFAGRGLGLATVYGIVRRHGGTVQVSSEVGQGSNFRVLLPIANTPPEPLIAEPAPTVRVHGSRLVLLADDEAMVRLGTQALLESTGFRVLVASDGEEAVSLFRAHHQEIVCVVLDLTMPKMSGVEAFRELRRIDPNVRVVLTSGYTTEDMRHRFAGEAVFGFVQKPDSIETVLAELLKVLQ